MYTIESIKNGLEDFFKIDLSNKKRDNRHFRARAIFYKLCFNLTYKPTYQSIANSVGKNHATVIHSIRRFDIDIKYDKELQQMYNSLTSTFKDFQIDEVSISDLMIGISELKKEVRSLEIKLEEEKNKPPMVSDYQEINLINDLMNKLDDEERYLLSCKLEALYKLNKGKVKL